MLLSIIERDGLLDPPGRARRRGAFFGVVVAGFIHQRGFRFELPHQVDNADNPDRNAFISSKPAGA